VCACESNEFCQFNLAPQMLLKVHRNTDLLAQIRWSTSQCVDERYDIVQAVSRFRMVAVFNRDSGNEMKNKSINNAHRIFREKPVAVPAKKHVPRGASRCFQNSKHDAVLPFAGLNSHSVNIETEHRSCVALTGNARKQQM
jgi:hypothetical protein